MEFPDLTITNVVLSPTEPVFPEDFQLIVTVLNQGTLDAVINYPSTILCGGSHTNCVFPFSLEQFRLAAGEQRTFNVISTAFGSQTGTKTITLTVDPANRVVESDEDNNTATIDVTISN